MKRNIAILSMLSMACMMSCQKDNTVSEAAEKLYEYDLSVVETKVVLPAWKFDCVWEDGDAIIVRSSASGGDQALLTGGATTQTGLFNLKTTMAPGTEVRVFYPATAGYGGGRVESAQTQTRTKQLDLFSCTWAYSDVVSLSETQPVQFALKHPLAAVRVKFKSEEFEGEKVTGLLFRSIGNAVAGDFTFDYENEKVVPQDGCVDYIELTMENTATISSAEYNSLCFMALPSEEEQEFYIMLNIRDKEARIPVKFKGVLKGGHVNEFVIDDLKTEDAALWYRAVDSRHMPVLGYGYGETNTYLIQYKEGTYGAALDPDPSIPSEVEVDYRFTGDFKSATPPDDVRFEFKKGYCNDGSWGIYTQDRTYAVNADKYLIGEPVDYKVKVTNIGADSGSPILLMIDNKTNEILWSWAFWNIAADGTRLQAYDFGNVKVANMDIGQVSVKDESTEYLKEMRRSLFYYQWGRPSPVFWQSKIQPYFGQNHPLNGTSPGIPVLGTGAVSLEESLRHPGEMIAGDVSQWDGATDTDEPADWLIDGSSHKDLWMNKGVKSIYDPCPKGWRVVHVDEYVNTYGSSKEGAVAHELGRYKVDDYYAGFWLDESKKILMNNAGYMSPKLRTSGNVKVAGYTEGTNSSSAGSCIVWTNSTNNSKGRTFRYDYYWTKYSGESSGESTDRQVRVVDNPRSFLYPVRCQVDEANR